MDTQVELVKQKADIVAMIDSRVKLMRAGKNFKANCPFHGEKTPSFFVSPDLQTFKCFGCGEGGDVFTFLQKYEGMNFPESLEYVAAKVGVTLKRDFRTSDEQKHRRFLEILHLSEEYYRYLLTSHQVGRKALSYLKNRGITEAVSKTFGLGYSADNWQGLHDFLVVKKHYTPEEVEATGMLIRGSSGRYYDRFRGRVMFPLKDFTGKTVGFSGRILPGGEPVKDEVDSADSTGSRQAGSPQAKYINSPETALYHKSRLLFGINEVRSTIRKKNRVVVVEGEFDMIGSFMAGVREVVAIKGSALTTEQIELLRRLTPNVVLALDADNAGSEATKRGIMVADSMGMNLSVVEIIDGKDPADLTQSKPELWKKLVASPVSVYDFLIDKAFGKYAAETGDGKKAISRDLVPMLARISNAVEREHYVGVVADKLKVTKKAVEDEVTKVELAGETKSRPEEAAAATVPLTRRVTLERYVVGCFLHMGDDLAKLAKHLPIVWLSDPGLQRLWETILSMLTKHPTGHIREVVPTLPMESQRLIQELLIPEIVMADEGRQSVEDLYHRGLRELQKLVEKAELSAISLKMADPETDEETKQELQADYARLARSLKTLDESQREG